MERRGEARVRLLRRPVLELLKINLSLAIFPLHKASQHLQVVHGERERKSAETIKTAAPKPGPSRVDGSASRTAFGSTPPTTSPEQLRLTDATPNPIDR